MLNIQLTEKEKEYLKRMAALQFPGSRENYSTRHPIHFLQEQAEEYVEVPMSSYEEYKDEIVRVEDCDCDYYSFDTVEALVANRLGFDLDDPDAVAHYNSEAESDGEVQFVPYKEAEAAEEIPGYDEPIYALEDYLTAYGIESEYVKLYRYGEGWDVKAVSFTHKGAVEMREELSNHIFRQTRTYAYTTVDGDFPVIMEFLMKCGKQLLAEEMSGIKCETKKHMLPEDVMEQFERCPNKEFCAAQYEFTNSNAEGVLQGATLSVMVYGEIKDWGGRKYPISRLRVLLAMNGEEKECSWPFECDRTGTSLLDSTKIIDLLNYARYI